MQEVLARGLLGLPVGVVVVDRRYDIQLLNNAVRRLLGLHGVAIGEELIHQLRGVPAVEVRAAIDAAFQPGAPRSADASTVGTPSVEQILAVETPTGEPRYLQIVCYLHTTEAPEPDAPTHRGRDTVLVVVLDVTQTERERRAREEERERERRGEADAIWAAVTPSPDRRHPLAETIVALLGLRSGN